MLVDYAVIEMGCFDDYLDAAPRAKTMKGNGITTFHLNFTQCFTFRQTNIVTATIIAKGIVEVILFKVGFQGYENICDMF